LARIEKPLPLKASSADTDVSALLRAWSDGDQDALQALTPIVYEELHRLARRYLRREPTGHSLQATALVNEAYMRLADYRRMQWQDRAHFFAVSAQAMRRILVDHARRHNVKRGRGVQRVPLEDVVVMAPGENASKGSDRRDAFLWRVDRGRNRRGAEGIDGNDQTRLACGQSLAVSRTDPLSSRHGRRTVEAR
jgi:RNA polymerase sigma factor (TIGR02999 family)